MYFKIVFSLCLVFLWVSAGPKCAGGQATGFTEKLRSPMIAIANKGEDTIVFVDLKTLKAVATARTGRGPHEVVVTPDGQFIFSANYEGQGDSLSKIDLGTMQEIQRIAIDPFRKPHGLAISRDGKRLYATCEADKSVIEVEVTTGKLLRTFPTEQEITHMLVLTPEERKLYTTNILSGTVTALDLESGRISAQIPTGRGAEGIDVTPDGKEVWVTNREEDTLSIIDATSDRVLETLPCKGFPIRLKITPDGKKALVSCYLNGSIAVFDVASRRQIQRTRLEERPLGRPIGLLIESNGQRVFVSESAKDQVLVIDLERLEVVDRIPAGRESDGLALVPARSE